MSRIARNLCSCVLFGSLSYGCMLGPDYRTPEAPVASDWLAGGDPLIAGEAPVDPHWWQGAFHDAALDQLVDVALAENLSLRSATLRVLQAQQYLAIAIGAQFPQQQQASGSASKQRQSGTTFESYGVGFNVGWELDLWGRFRRQVESASASLDASVASYDGVLVSLVAQVAQTYILIRTYETRVAYAERNVQIQEESARITLAKYQSGAVTQLDVSQAETLLNNTRATVSGLRLSLAQLKISLAILLGRLPQDLGNVLGDEQAGIPTAPPSIALGMPQDLIRRRPDIRIAERQLAAQSAQIGVAITDLYPSLSIGGSIGTAAADTSDLFDSDSKTWDVFGGFTWNLFNYGRLTSNVRLQDATFQQLLVDYRDTVLSAQGDTESSIAAYLESHRQLRSYVLAAEASQRALDVAVVQYKQGEIPFNTVINVLTAHVQQQDLLASAEGSVATSLVQVYRALGGGWEIRDGRDPVDSLPEATRQQMIERTGAWKGHLQ
jgi:NodT family efflux transporter outer membrane factor (OMF) lipoprotein